jgi:hypothetical protein
MFGNEHLISCQRRKAALLQQSAAHRRVLLAEAQNLRPLVGWVDVSLDAARKARTGWTTLAPLLACWRMREHQSPGLIHKLANALSVARSLAALWNGRRGR